ncbi:MAG: PAC2 family protein [Candidatus Diapherotrites archaeon]|nr:PAC2 family protein [Candidatus Diapherotrites archaeon]
MSSKVEVSIVETGPSVKMEDFTLIEGFPGMGLVGTIAAKYLVEKMDFKEIGYIHADSFMPIIRIHDGLPVRPSRIYVNESAKLVVLISEQIIQKQHTQVVAEKIVDWVRDRRIKRIISLSGIGSEPDSKEFKIYGIASNEASKKLLQDHKIQLIKEGITTGVTALMMLELKDDKNIEAISLLGSIKIGADYKAAAELLKKLNEVMSWNINVEPLMKEAKETEKELIKQLDKLKETHDDVQKFEDQAPMYA